MGMFVPPPPNWSDEEFHAWLMTRRRWMRVQWGILIVGTPLAIVLGVLLAIWTQ